MASVTTDLNFPSTTAYFGVIQFRVPARILNHLIESGHSVRTAELVTLGDVCAHPTDCFQGLYRHDHDRSYCFTGPASSDYDRRRFLFAFFCTYDFEIFEWRHEERARIDPRHPASCVEKRFDIHIDPTSKNPNHDS